MRKLCVLGAVVCGVVLASAGAARADKFQKLAASAVKLDTVGDVAGLFWTATVDCAKMGDDLARRQCEGVKAARAEAAAGKTYIAWGDASAFFVGEWDAAKGGLPIGVRGCIACGTPIDVGGERRYFVTKGDVGVVGGAVQGPEIHKAVRKFANEAAARKWRDTVVPRLRTQFIFKIPARPTVWTQGGAKGFTVELVAFRVYDPCDGAMICADPPSENEKADRAACGGGDPSGTDIVGEEKKPEEPKKPAEPQLPETLSSYQINKAMQKTRTEVNACFVTYGVPGKADLTIEIGNDGKVRKVELRGEFEDTPTGTCIIEAVQETEFPPFKKPSMTISYPFILR